MANLKAEADSVWTTIIQLVADLVRASACALVGFALVWVVGKVVGTDDETYKTARYLINVMFVGGAIVISFMGVASLCSESFRSFWRSFKSGGKQ